MCEGGQAVDAWLASTKTTREGLVEKLNQYAKRRRSNKRASRTALWRWCVGSGEIPLIFALALRDICDAPVSSWCVAESASGMPRAS